ncbi:hypothetical protein DL240_14115 [Lujinxingia litoralis]|uniref:AgmX/PglI C-terminal domain-containing protein n=1 Tax=Lujinxingia litoralis TaxID=2211119 RepID=A0A328C761_9DELT|nr:AgmX/PglI C-terminal domain-containing protein [Lujinxingia litoralis]RAL21257.1 hypothetical protein DL240_14115 [Lujinxingia litoralis]
MSAKTRVATLAIVGGLMGAVGYGMLASSGEAEVEAEKTPGRSASAPVASAKGGAFAGRAMSAGGGAETQQGAVGGAEDRVEAGEGGAQAQRSERRTREAVQPGAVSPDAGEEGGMKGVGPLRWARQPLSPEALAVLEDELDEGEMRQAQELAMRQDRRRSIEAVEAGVRGCYEALRREQPERGGRVALRWTMVAAGGVGQVVDAVITANVGLRDAGFEGCVAQALRGLEFEAVGEAEVVVEWPFMPREVGVQ